MKSILLTFVITCATLFSQEPAAAPKSQRVVKLITRKGSSDMWTATAFFISPTKLLTAAHTFKKSKDQWVVIAGVETHCTVIKIDFKKDIAVLETDVVSDSYYKLAGKIYVKGFPYGGLLSEASGQIDDGRIHSKIYFAKGMSGGPIEDENGLVIGMGVQGDSGNSEDVCRFIPASLLADFIK